MKVFEDSKGQIWVGTYEHGMGAGVGSYNGHFWQNFSTKDGLIDNCVYSMFEDPSGNMWFGSVKGISIFDGKKWHTLTKKDGLVDNRVYCMLIDFTKKDVVRDRSRCQPLRRFQLAYIYPKREPD